MGILKKISRKKVLGFWAGDENNFTFLDPIIKELSKDYKTKKHEYDGDNAMLEKQVNSCDLAWFEWANGPLVPASAFDTKTPFICRLHKYEAYTNDPKKIKWSAVKRLIFISSAVKETFNNNFPEAAKTVNEVLIRNGVDTHKYSSDSNRKNSFKIAYIGRFHYHKNPSLLLQIFNKVYKQDDSYRLYLLGEFVDPVIKEYFWDQVDKLGLKDAVFYEGVRKDVDNWLADKDYFLQPSIIEGQSVAALEAISSGLKPVIHNYFEAEKMFPKEFLFDTLDEAVEKILDKKLDRKSYRDYVIDNNDWTEQVSKIKGLIEGVLNGKS